MKFLHFDLFARFSYGCADLITSNKPQASRNFRHLGRKHAAKGIGQAEIELFCDALLLAIIEFLDEFILDDVITSWVHLLAYVTMEMTRDKIRYLPREHHLRRIGVLSGDGPSNHSATSSWSSDEDSRASEDAPGDAVQNIFPDNTFDVDGNLPCFQSLLNLSKPD